jgi:hypothetical protein
MERPEIDKQVDNLLQAYSPEVRDLARSVRDQINAMLPYVTEKVYSGWKVILCSVDGSMKRGICAISPQREYVNLIFYRGTDLDDPGCLLEGDGKKIRHITITDAAQIRRRDVRRLIKVAAGLAEAPGTV